MKIKIADFSQKKSLLIISSTILIIATICAIFIFKTHEFIYNEISTKNLIIIIASILFCLILFIAYLIIKPLKSIDFSSKQNELKKDLDDTTYINKEIKAIKYCLNSVIKKMKTINWHGNKYKSRYILPWYLIIGNQHSGKTTILINSEQKFSPMEQGKDIPSRLKPTSQCEVFFTDKAIFIDTPGKFTESETGSTSNKLWLELLNQLLKIRRITPINGIIVCVNMREIITGDYAKRELSAKTINKRIKEAMNKLYSHIPIYVIFTKCDAIPGFNEFFNDLSRSEREQIFGYLSNEEYIELDKINIALKYLVKTINEQTISKIHRERDIVSRGDIFRFSQEMSQIESEIEDYIVNIFNTTKFDKPIMLRGFLLTSSYTSENSISFPISKEKFNLQKNSSESRKESEKILFLKYFFDKFLVQESNLSKKYNNYNYTTLLSHHGLHSLSILAIILLAFFISLSFINNNSKLLHLSNNHLDLDTELKVKDITADTKAELPILSKILYATNIYNPENDSNINHGYGLYQGKYFYNATNRAYLGLLNTRFLPSLRMAAIANLEKSFDNAEKLKIAFKAYLMLCNPEKIQIEFLTNYLEHLWSDQYQGQENVRNTLSNHMNYLLNHGIIATEPDFLIVERVRKILLKMPIASVVYQQLQEEVIGHGKQPFSFHNAIGESPFTGDTYSIPYLYTRKGFDEYLTKHCNDIIKNIADDEWIYGENSIALSKADLNKVQKEVRKLYFRDYIQYWNQAIQALQVRTPTSLTDVRALAEQLTVGIPPVVLIVREIRANTDFSDERTTIESTSSHTADINLVKNSATDHDAITIKEYFQPIRNLLLDDGNLNPTLKSVTSNMSIIADYFNKILTSDNKDKAIMDAILELIEEKNNVLRNLNSSIDQLPSPAKKWYSTIVGSGLHEMFLMCANCVNRAYQEHVIAVYNKNLRNYFPFNINADKDVNIEDFSNFFRAGGVLDNFYDTYLHPFITRSGTLRNIMGHTLPIATKAVKHLQLANRVQEAFFISGRELGINFLIEPYALDSELKQMLLSHAGKYIKYWHGPVQGASFTWPIPNGLTDLTTLETTDLNGQNSKLTSRGDWSLFKIFQKGNIKRQEGNTCLLEIIHNEKWTQLLIQFRSKINPFDSKVCTFSLPDNLL